MVSRYLVCLLIITFLMPFVAAIVIIGFVIGQVFDRGGPASAINLTHALAWGTAVSLALWLVMPAIMLVLFPKVATADGIGKLNADELMGQIDMLKTQIDQVKAINARQGTADPSVGDDAALAISTTEDLYEQLVVGMQQSGPHWLLGTAYAAAWETLHQAEAELTMVEPPGLLYRHALEARLHLADGKVPNAAQLSADLDTIIKAMQLTPGSAAGATGSPPTTPCPGCDMQTRSKLLTIRKEIFDARDNIWNSTLRVRNRVLLTALLVEFGALVLLLAAFIGNTDTTAPLAGLTFFALGAFLGGLYGRLRDAMEADSASDDYGLSTARLITTPIYSGMAAVIGVGLIEVLKHPGDSTSTQFFQTMYAATPFHYLLAIVFGLVPAEVFHRLDQAKSAIDGDQGTSSAAGKPATT